MAMRFPPRFPILPLLAITLLAGGCSSVPKPETSYPPTERDKDRERIGTLSGNQDGIVLFGGNRGQSRGDASGATAGIGVNAFLWKASLDTISFMPIASADPFGGVILTDWYTPPQTPNERLKLNVFIKDTQLRSDGVSVSVFRQVRRGNDWQDSPAAPETGRALENAILARARQLRVGASGQ